MIFRVQALVASFVCELPAIVGCAILRAGMRRFERLHPCVKSGLTGQMVSLPKARGEDRRRIALTLVKKPYTPFLRKNQFFPAPAKQCGQWDSGNS
jgi:hypothetical protein